MKNEIFHLPDTPTNRISVKDIAKGVIRITVATKPYFPFQDCILQILAAGKSYTVRYTKQTGRSDLLHLGSELIFDLNVKPNGQLKFTKLASDKFSIEAV